jgi:hypothetical protein
MKSPSVRRFGFLHRCHDLPGGLRNQPRSLTICPFTGGLVSVLDVGPRMNHR